MQKKRRLKKSVKKILRITLITFIVILTGISYSLVTDADEEDRSTYPAYQNTISIDTQSFGKLSLSVTAEEHILPKDTKVSLKEVTDTEYKNIQSKLQEDAEENNTDMKGILLYDLSFTDSNTNEIPSFDGTKINVYASYEKDASALTENNNEDVSVKLINKDQQYTVTDLTSDDYKVDTDDNNAVKDMSMTVHGSTYYALVWSKRPEITVHAVDEAGNELIPSDTIQLTDDEYTDTFTPSVEGYSLTSVTGDNTEITKVKPEKGKLYYNNGDDWFEASDSNVYFHYVSNNTSEDTDSNETQQQTVTEEVTEPETEETTSKVTTDNRKQLTETSKDKKYTVTVTYGDDAGLPEGTTLSVTGIDTTEEKYADAKKAVAESKNVDADTLGMEALDITLLDVDGNKVEPSNASDVQVSISVNDLPDNVDSVEIHHITDTEVQDVTADTVAEDVGVSDNSANAEFSVSSFSVFTITWEKPINSKTGSTDTLSDHVDNNADEAVKDAENGSTEQKTDDTDGEKTPVTEEEKANNDIISTPAADDNKKTITSTDGLYTITYDKDDENISDTATVAVTSVEDKDKNNEYKQMVANAEKIDDLDSFSMAAMDISIVDDGTEVEPSKDITVSIDVSGIVPDDAIDVQVHHIVNKKAELQTQAAKSNFLMKGIKKLQSALTADKDVAEDTDAKYEDGKVSFTTSSLSVFTITWKVDGKRFSSVNINYVDENGLTVADPSSIPTGSDSLSSNTVVDLSTWANDDNGNSRIAHYTFVEARIGDKINGTVITGLKAVADTTSTPNTYKLFYTTKSPLSNATDADWVQYTDATSGNTANNANVYLVYKSAMTMPVTFHFLTLDGQPIKDSYGNEITKVIDGATLSSGLDMISWTPNNSPNGYTLKSSNGINNQNQYNSTRVTLAVASGVLGDTYLRWLKYQQDSSDGKYYMYAGRGQNANYKTPGKITNGNNIYVTLQPASNLSVTIHRVDADGNTIANDVTKNVSDGSAITLTEDDLAVSGYTATSGYYNWLSKDSKGTAFATMTYSQAKGVDSATVNTIWKSSYKTDANAEGSSDTTNLETELWVVYTAENNTPVTVHHLNQSGVEIHDVTTLKMENDQTLYVTSDASDVIVAATSISGYTPSYGYFNASGTNQNFYSMDYSYDSSSSQWSSSYKETSEATSGTPITPAVKDIYVVYTLNTTNSVSIKLHAVDESGGYLAEKTLSRSNSSSTWKNKWDGWTFNSGEFAFSDVGTYQRSDIGVFGQNTSMAFLYKTDSNGNFIATGTGNTTDKDDYDETDHPNGVHTIKLNGNDVVYTDAWMVYGGTNAQKGITIHHVDESGNELHEPTYARASNGDTITPSEHAADISGYALKEGHLNTADGQVFTVLAYSYDSTQSDTTKRWSSMYATVDNPTANTATDTVVNDVYLVYTKGASLTVHYVDMSGNTLKESNVNVPNETVSLTGTNTDATDLTTAAGAGNTPPGYVKTISGYTYVNTRTDSVSGPQVKSVRLQNGEVQYLTSNNYTLTKQGNNPRWARIASTGVTYTLYYEESNFRLYDNQNGSISLNYVGKTRDADSLDVYSATVNTASSVITYTIKPSSTTSGSGSGAEAVTNYTLIVEEWTPSTSTEIYEIYTTTDGGTIWVNDNLKYDGYFSVGMDDTVKTNIENSTWSNVYYTWHRVTRDAVIPMSNAKDATEIANYTTDNPVARKQTGRFWNVAYSSGERTWLDVLADQGARTTDTEAGYYVVLHYTSGGTESSLTSKVAPVDYYAQLENGSFETPVVYTVTDKDKKQKDSNGKDINNSKQGTQTSYFAGNQTTNYNYKNNGGVWQSTAETADSSRVAIEVFNINEGNTGIGNVWNGAPTAAEGVQFAELNAESAGALYQDVLTLPGESLSYWFSHRARGQNSNSTKEYDTMYLVIMPTSEAMIAAKDGGELTDQSDLIDFINEHTNNGYSYSKPTAADYAKTTGQADIICNENGILIARVTSSDQEWNAIKNINGYVAKGSLTRFFFVAGPTAWSGESGSNAAVLNATHGNLIDGVGYSTDPDAGDDFNLTVTKTFSGLTNDEIAKLADNGYQITITDKYATTSSGALIESDEKKHQNKALNGAVLKFTYTHTIGSDVYTWKPTATLNGDDLFNRTNNDSSGSYTVNDDGTVTLIWSFVRESLDDNTNTTVFNYYVDESNTAVTGKSLTVSQTQSPQSSIKEKAAEVVSGTKARFNLTNSYKIITDSEQPELVITKRFTGITPEVVDSFLGRGYKITVTKTAQEDGTSVSNVFTDLTADADNLDSNITLIRPTTTDGSTTLKWVISGNNWGPGTYSITETGYASTTYPVKVIKVNSSVDSSPSQDTKTENNISAGVESTKAALTYTNEDTKTPETGHSSLSEDTLTNLNISTNLIIAQFTESGSDKRYLVWTSSAVGSNVARTILNKIQASDGFNDSAATLEKIKFVSGENPGSLALTTGSKNTLTYNSDTGAVSFAKGESETGNWTKMYSAQASGMDVADIAVVNQYEPAIRIMKVDKNNNSTLLSKAQFRLYKLESDSNSGTSTELNSSGQNFMNDKNTQSESGSADDSNVPGTNGNYTPPQDENGDYEIEFSKQNPGWTDEEDETSYVPSLINSLVTTVHAEDNKLYLTSKTDAKTAANWSSSGTPAVFETSDGNNQTTLGIVSLPTLPAGTYYLEEVKAPNGYNMPTSNPVATIKVDSNGVVTVVKGDSTAVNTSNKTSDDIAWCDWNSPYYTITVSNSPGYSLPNTGGKGTTLYIALGGMILIIAGWLGLQRARKRGTQQ